jgi:hypothetical protein
MQRVQTLRSRCARCNQHANAFLQAGVFLSVLLSLCAAHKK